MNVLIVEDDRVISLVISRMVKSMGNHIVGPVPKGELALDLINQENVDLILMDIMLEGKLDGIETMKQIREKYDTPVIYVTGNSDKSTKDRAEPTGYVDYLVKPVSHTQLKQSIEAAFSSNGTG